MTSKEPLRFGLKYVGPHTACTLLGLWSEGSMSLSLQEFRSLVKIISNFLEELEEVRAERSDLNRHL